MVDDDGPNGTETEKCARSIDGGQWRAKRRNEGPFGRRSDRWLAPTSSVPVAAPDPNNQTPTEMEFIERGNGEYKKPS